MVQAWVQDSSPQPRATSDVLPSVKSGGLGSSLLPAPLSIGFLYMTAIGLHVECRLRSTARSCRARRARVPRCSLVTAGSLRWLTGQNARHRTSYRYYALYDHRESVHVGVRRDPRGKFVSSGKQRETAWRAEPELSELPVWLRTCTMTRANPGKGGEKGLTTPYRPKVSYASNRRRAH